MGKRYYCDYCNKTMVDTPSTIKTHNNGLAHQKLVQEHYRQYKDPELILQEEATKKPCLRFAKGECLFGALCRFSHYTREEIETFRRYVASKSCHNQPYQHPNFEELYNKLQTDKDNAKTQNDSVPNENEVWYDSNGATYILPWTYNSVLDNYGDSLPPSIKRMKLMDFENANIIEWG
ncbi:hypothetical protein ACJJTC_013653 [Scirpophaga incertulas]